MMILCNCLTKLHKYKKALLRALDAASSNSSFYTNATWLNQIKKDNPAFVHNTSTSRSLNNDKKSTQVSNTNREVNQANQNTVLDVNVLANGFMNSPKACIISTSSASILINCGEGTRRIINETYLLKSRNIDHVFLTRFDWSVVGGLQGVCRNIHYNADFTGNKDLQIHSPIEFHENKNFLMTKEIDIKQHNYKMRDECDGGRFVVKRIDMTAKSKKKPQRPVWSYLFKFKKV
jgi:hypothetical protein